MDKKSIDQIRLCINEMQMVRQLIDTKTADTFCNRLLGIYVMMRVDDVTKIWSHNIPRDTMERHLAEGVKAVYSFLGVKTEVVPGKEYLELLSRNA